MWRRMYAWRTVIQYSNGLVRADRSRVWFTQNYGPEISDYGLGEYTVSSHVGCLAARTPHRRARLREGPRRATASRATRARSLVTRESRRLHSRLVKKGASERLASASVSAAGSLTDR